MTLRTITSYRNDTSRLQFVPHLVGADFTTRRPALTRGIDKPRPYRTRFVSSAGTRGILLRLLSMIAPPAHSKICTALVTQLRAVRALGCSWGVRGRQFWPFPAEFRCPGGPGRNPDFDTSWKACCGPAIEGGRSRKEEERKSKNKDGK